MNGVCCSLSVCVTPWRGIMREELRKEQSLITEKEILLRIQKNPDEHLAAYDLEYYDAYNLGYNLVLAKNGIDEVNVVVSRDTFNQYLKEKYQIRGYPCNIRYESYLELMTSSKKELFDLYISEKLNASNTLNIEYEKIHFSTSKTLEVKLQQIFKRPGMYFGNNFSSMHLGSFFLGYKWAEKDYGFKKSELIEKLESFQVWYDKKEPFAIGYPWYRTMLIITLHHYRDSFNCFLQDYSDFLEGKDSNCRLKESVDIAFKEIMKNQ